MALGGGGNAGRSGSCTGTGGRGECARMNPNPEDPADPDPDPDQDQDVMSLRSWIERRRLRSLSSSVGSLVDSMERRTQKTYRYGIALVCIGATLNWLGFAQGHGYVDPLRYLGVACVISGSFCVCMAMCRWLGRPIAVSSTPGLCRIVGDGAISSHAAGDVHVINVAVPNYISSAQSLSKPPDYDTLLPSSEPPPYEEAIKLVKCQPTSSSVSLAVPTPAPAAAAVRPSTTTTTISCSAAAQGKISSVLPPPYRPSSADCVRELDEYGRPRHPRILSSKDEGQNYVQRQTETESSPFKNVPVQVPQTWNDSAV